MNDYDSMREARRILFNAQTKAAITEDWADAYNTLNEGINAARALLNIQTKGRTR